MVKVVCLFKSPIKTWQNKNGQGFVLNMDFADCSLLASTKKQSDACDAI